tara:strand:+ start:511 stop:1428 length:918 start_codon:yes stop_codon:yes gene_type:complete
MKRSKLALHGQLGFANTRTPIFFYIRNSVVCACLLLGLASLAYAEAPVIDATPSGIYPDQPTMPVAVPVVSHSVEAQLKQLNQKIARLQQANQDLTNLVSMQHREIALLKAKKAYPSAKLHAKLSPVPHHIPVKNKVEQVAPAIHAAPTVHAAPQPKMVVLDQTSQPTNQPKKPVTNPKTEDGYQQAYALVKAQQYSQAIPKLQAYVSANPTGAHAGDAYYWLGQLQAISGNNDKAIEAYTTLVNHYPKAEHVPDAMLQLAAFAKENQQWTQAKQWLNKIIIAYPNSAAVRLAKVRLQQLQDAGH